MARYRHVARFYDVLSLEWPVYGKGRAEAVRLAGLRRGDRVIDVGCGTGLNFALLQRSVGAHGRIVGVDLSASMLAQARRRSVRAGWRNVRVVQADAAALDAGLLRRAGAPARYDAAIATYALSLMPDWAEAWDRMCGLVSHGGPVAVVDLALPDDRWRLARPLARVACALGGSDPHRTTWLAAERELDHVTGLDLWGGHVRVRVGGAPSRPAEGGESTGRPDPGNSGN